MVCKNCVYYEKLNNKSFYCEKHDDIFNELGNDDNWCTHFKSLDEVKTELTALERAYYDDVEARNYPSEPEKKPLNYKENFMKIFIIAVAVLFTSFVCSCASIMQKENTKYSEKEIDVEECIKTDTAYLIANYGKGNFRWYECGVQLKDYLDAENNDGSVVDLTNIFMVISDKDNSFDTNIVMFRHTQKEDTIEILSSLWVEEDVNIKENLVDVKFKTAVKLARKTTPILHTKHVVLRKHLGPLDINPQYTFGNNHGLLFVDAHTGVVSYEQPAFRGTGFETWLGEWPQK